MTRLLLAQAEADTVRPSDLEPMFADFHEEERHREWLYEALYQEQQEALAEWCQRQAGLS